jgi:excisionase family DNA binding protein
LVQTLSPPTEEPGPTRASTQDLLTTKEAAELLRVSPSTLERWRSTGNPALPFQKLGSGKRAPVLYTRKAILDLIEQNTHLSTSTYKTGA